MAEITDSPFRILCLRGGAGAVFGEMVSARALAHGNKKTLAMLSLLPQEHPFAAQIFGDDAEAMAFAARKARLAGADIIDINAGCPVKKIVRAGAGAALMKDEKLFAAIVKAAVKSAGAPVTVKIRTGFSAGESISPGLAWIAQAEGACAVSVHARPAEAAHAGPVDLKILEQTCRRVSIPVIGNGGVACAKDALALFSAGCAGVMIGRAAIGNPGIFGSIARELSGGTPSVPTAKDRAETFLELLSANAAAYGEKKGLLRARKTAGWWLAGFPHSAGLRRSFVAENDYSLARKLIEEAVSGLS